MLYGWLIIPDNSGSIEVKYLDSEVHNSGATPPRDSFYRHSILAASFD